MKIYISCDLGALLWSKTSGQDLKPMCSWCCLPACWWCGYVEGPKHEMQDHHHQSHSHRLLLFACQCGSSTFEGVSGILLVFHSPLLLADQESFAVELPSYIGLLGCLSFSLADWYKYSHRSCIGGNGSEMSFVIQLSMHFVCISIWRCMLLLIYYTLRIVFLV